MKSICRKSGLIGSLFLSLFLYSATIHVGWSLLRASEASAAPKKGSMMAQGNSFSDIAKAVQLVSSLAIGIREYALAASVSNEGHWHLVNASGERATVSSADELKQALKWLMPEKFYLRPDLIIFYISDFSLVKNPDHLDMLPNGARLRIVVGANDYKLMVKPRGEKMPNFAELRDHIHVALDDVAKVREAAWQVERVIEQGSVRFLRLKQGAAKSIPSVPAVGDGGMPRLDVVDPYFLEKALRPLTGQTAVVTGKVVGDLLYFEKNDDADRSILVGDMMKLARKLDLDLVILNTGEARQPGGRDWLWRKTGVTGLEKAFQAKKLGDFLDILGAGRDGFDISVGQFNRSRASLKVKPQMRPPGLLEPKKPAKGGDGIGSVFTDVMASIKGDVVVSSIALSLRSSHRLKELDRRVIPGVPSAIQYGYVATMVLGLLGLPIALLWWGAIWPPEKQEEYGTRSAYWSATAVRWVLFAAIFLPLVATPAFAVQFGHFVQAVFAGPSKWFARSG